MGSLQLEVDQLLEELLACEIGFVPDDDRSPGDSGAVPMSMSRRGDRCCLAGH